MRPGKECREPIFMSFHIMVQTMAVDLTNCFPHLMFSSPHFIAHDTAHFIVFPQHLLNTGGISPWVVVFILFFLITLVLGVFPSQWSFRIGASWAGLDKLNVLLLNPLLSHSISHDTENENEMKWAVDTYVYTDEFSCYNNAKNWTKGWHCTSYYRQCCHVCLQMVWLSRFSPWKTQVAFLA